MPGFFANASAFLRELLRRRCPTGTAEGLPEDGGPLLIAGHRGSPLFFPENTLPSFAKALDDGANAIELDLCITRDERIVAWHDWTPNGTVAWIRWLEIEPENNFRPVHPDRNEYQIPVCDLDLELFRRKYGYIHKKGDRPYPVEIPTLEQIVAWARGEERLKGLFLDCKIPEDCLEYGEAFIRELDRIVEPLVGRMELILEVNNRGMLPHALASRTVDRVSLDVAVNPGLVLDITPYSSAHEAVRRNLGASLVLRPRMTTVAPWTTWRRILRREMAIVRDAPEGERPLLIAATVNRPEEFRYLRKMGVRAFQTDLPHVMAQIEPPSR